MDTRYLKTLVATAETGSFSKAAELLYLTQSAVSQRIKILEERFGHQLLDRSGSVLVPTEAGKLVLEKARDFLVMELGMLEELKRLNTEKRLSFCCTPTFGMAYLPGVLNDFMLQHADLVNLNFVFQQPEMALRGLKEKSFDLVIIEHCDNLDLSSFHTHPLPTDELIFIGAPALQLPASPVDLELLLRHRLYARRDGCSSKLLLRNNLAALNRKLESFSSIVVSDDLHFNIQRVQVGGGISFISRSLVNIQLDSGLLCAHHVKGFNHFRHRTAVLHKNLASDPVLQSFLKCVDAVFGPPSAGAAWNNQQICSC
jgi:LysR family transcriptional regulator, transcriptional activator of the cysJI operon